MLGHLRTDSSLIVQNWNPPERDSEHSEESIVFIFLGRFCHFEIVRSENYFLFTDRLIEKYFTHAVGSPLQTSNFYKYSTPSRGFPQTSFLPKESL